MKYSGELDVHMKEKWSNCAFAAWADQGSVELITSKLWKTLATSCEELTHWKRLWCWEGLGAGGEGDARGWDGWMASLTRWTWVWVNSGSWWWTGRPGMLQFMGSQRVWHDWATGLNWTEALEKRGALYLQLVIFSRLWKWFPFMFFGCRCSNWGTKQLGAPSTKQAAGVAVCVNSLVSDSLRPHGQWPTRFLSPWDFSGKNAGVSCRFLLLPGPGIEPTSLVSLTLAGRFFTAKPSGKV